MLTLTPLGCGDPSWHKLLISEPGHAYWQKHFRFKGYWNGILIIDWFNIQVDCLLIWSIENRYRLSISFLWSDPDNYIVFTTSKLDNGNTYATCDHIQQYVGSDIGHDIVPAACKGLRGNCIFDHVLCAVSKLSRLQIVWKIQTWLYNFSRPCGSWVIDQNYIYLI